MRTLLLWRMPTWYIHELGNSPSDVLLVPQVHRVPTTGLLSAVKSSKGTTCSKKCHDKALRFLLPNEQALPTRTGRLVMSGTFAANSLRFTPSNWDQPQGLLAAAVKDNALADSTFAIRFYVVAPSDPDIDGNFHVFPVMDERTLPGENADFPLVSAVYTRCNIV